MFKNYFTVAWRNILKNKTYSSINILGLAVGMAVAMMIGLWVYDELSFNKYHQHYDRLARVLVNHTFNDQVNTQRAQPVPLGKELHDKYGNDFEHISMASWSYGHFLSHEETRLSKEGMFVEPEFMEMSSLKMISGNRDALKDPHSIILNASLAKTMFGNADAMGKVIKIDNFITVRVTGVFEDFPYNSEFAPTLFLSPWSLYESEFDWVKSSVQNWGNSSFQTYVQLKEGADFAQVSQKIKDVLVRNNPRADTKPALFLHPMSKWHLYGEFQNGINTGGNIQFVWLFSLIGAFVLILACINFMNLSTARSEKRAKEVGLRKAIGSLKGQLVIQFLSESFLFVVLAFGLSILFTTLSLNWFNQLSDKKMVFPFTNLYFWLVSLLFITLTALVAGSYPALYLSSFKPVKILKGTFRAGRWAGVPRKVLVVTQFTVSFILIIGTIIVYRQILHAKDRPIGYDSKGLITTYGYPFGDPSNNPQKFDALSNELAKTGAIVSLAKTSSPTTAIYSNQSDFEWEGKDPNKTPNFGVVWCSHNYGKTVGLQFVQGRDFSRAFATDTAGIILNESAVRFMGLKDPVGKTIRYDHQFSLTVIGVVRDMLMESPYAGTQPVVFMVNYDRANILTVKLNPSMSAGQALSKIEPVFKKFNPESIFEYQFTDEEFAKKFTNEERIGKLASVFAGLAIFISCLGLFGLASYVAEQRTKEIGIRKVLGASVYNLWRMLSKDFVALVIISCFIAIPVAWYFLDQWLMKYEYRTEITWWIFAAAAAGILVITILTVSFQAIKAAIANPVKSLRNE